jgi:uncharacterized caspase-like protein
MRTEGDVKRALLIGSEVAGLTGVHRDVAAMADVLRGHGFTTVAATGRDASADGIVGQLRDLAADTAEGDAAVVYYSGHGGRIRTAAVAWTYSARRRDRNQWHRVHSRLSHPIMAQATPLISP